MRKLFPQAALVLACLYAPAIYAHEKNFTDTIAIVHQLDGNLSEWKPEAFTTDGETKIQYALHHDASNLYLALRVSDPAEQMKMMMQGMYLYVDKKGKKRENTGIEFPVKRSRDGGGGGFGGGRPSGADENGGGRPDPKAMRERMASMMIFLKSFGFGDGEEKTQLITQADAVNVAFDWDENNQFMIEYLIPMKLLGDKEELAGKPLGIGWKINGIQAPSASGSDFASVPGGSAGRGGGGGGRGPATRSSTPRADFSSNDSRFREQSFWTKYTLNF
jgi:hypothetical protein